MNRKDSSIEYQSLHQEVLKGNIHNFNNSPKPLPMKSRTAQWEYQSYSTSLDETVTVSDSPKLDFLLLQSGQILNFVNRMKRVMHTASRGGRHEEEGVVGIEIRMRSRDSVIVILRHSHYSNRCKGYERYREKDCYSCGLSSVVIPT